MQVSSAALIGIGITFVSATALILLRKSKPKAFPVWILLILLGASLLLSIESTGNIASPYIGLWVILALLSGVGGLRSLLSIALGMVIYAGHVYLSESPSLLGWAVYLLSMVLPLVLSYFVWNQRFKDQDRSSRAVTDLTSQLTNESTKSEIIINAIADGVLLIDTGGTIQLINPAAQQIIGWGEEDAVHLDYRSVLKIIDSKDDVIEGDNDPVQKSLKTGTSVITDKLGIRTVSGKQLLASIMVSPIEGSNSGVIVVFRDITAQRAEERDQAEFISTASHEMRTPVAAIEGYIGLALNPQTAVIDDKARTFLTKAQESAKHLGRLFQDLLDISKLEDGRLANNPQDIDMVAYIRGLLDEFMSQFAAKGIGLRFEPDTSTATAGQNIEPIYFAHADPDHLHEILSNLVTNALKYTLEGTVSVDVSGDSDHVYVTVKDTGLGIPAEDLPHLFQKFYRVDNTDTREIGGTGLGLYLARRLSETMGGHLTVNSTYGTGSTFTVDLPRVKKGIIEQTIEPDSAIPPQTKTKL